MEILFLMAVLKNSFFILPMKRKRYAIDVAKNYQKRRKTSGRPYTTSSTFVPRKGYASVARTRGGAVTGEMKYFDSVRDNVAVGSSATWASTVYDPNVFPVANMNCLFAPTQGAGISQRIGKACKVYKIKITGCFSVPSQTNQVLADAGSYIRLMLVCDKQSNSTQMTGTQLMTSPGVASTILAVETFQNIDNFGRFAVLKDKHIIMQNPDITWDGTNLEQAGLLRIFKLTWKPKVPMEVRFNSVNGGTIADIVDYSFHLLANNSSSDLNPNISYNCRVCYKE